jgi:hypothetical protein
LAAPGVGEESAGLGFSALESSGEGKICKGHVGEQW